MPLFCVNCGTPYDASDKFCNACGKQLPKPAPGTPQGSELEEGSDVSASPPPITSENIGSEFSIQKNLNPPSFHPIRAGSIPFNRFTLCGIAAILSASTVGFVLLDSIYRGKATLVPLLIVALLTLPVCINRSRSLWKSIENFAGCEDTSKNFLYILRRRLLFFACLFVGIGALIGAQVGRSGAETQAYIRDLNLYREIGDRISKARNTAEKTISGQIAMYHIIEPDVLALKPVVERLQAENSQYDAKYPAAHESSLRSAEAFRRTSKRQELLIQQIEVAKEIENVQGQNIQLSLYKEKMLPILAEEDGLDGR